MSLDLECSNWLRIGVMTRTWLLLVLTAYRFFARSDQALAIGPGRCSKNLKSMARVHFQETFQLPEAA